jgi:hypothetical protein
VSALAEPSNILADLASSAQSSVQKLGEVLSGINPETLKELASNVRSMKISANSIAKSSTYYESSIGELTKVSAEFQRTMGALKTAFTDNSSGVERMERTLTGARDEVRRQGEALAVSLNSMASTFERLEASVLKRMEQDSGIFENANQMVEAADEHLKQLAKGAQELFSSTRNVTLAASALRDAVTPLATDLATALNKQLTSFQREEGALFAQMRESLVAISLNLARASEWIAMTAQSQRIGVPIARLSGDLGAAGSVVTETSSGAGSSGAADNKLSSQDEQTSRSQAEKSGAINEAPPRSNDEEPKSVATDGGKGEGSSQRFCLSEKPTSDLPMLDADKQSVSAEGDPRPYEALKASDDAKYLHSNQNVEGFAGNVGTQRRTVETRSARFEVGHPELDRDNDGNPFHVVPEASGKLDNSDEKADSNSVNARSPKLEPRRRSLFAWLKRARE